MDLCVNEFGNCAHEGPRVLEHPQPDSAEDYRAMRYNMLPGDETSGTIDVQLITQKENQGGGLW